MKKIFHDSFCIFANNKYKMKKIIILLIISSLSYFSFGQHPTNLQATNPTSNSVVLSWIESMCNSTVNLKFRITGTGANGWTELTTVSSPYLLTGLIPASSYEFYVKCVGIVSWSSLAYFTTLDSVNCNLSTSVTINNSTCDGSYDGSASVTVLNGVPPYSYLWGNNATTSSINSVPNDTYIVTTNDLIGCSKIDTILLGFDNLIALSQFVSVFTDTTRPEFPNTLQSYQVWAYDTLRLSNNGCSVNIRPEFIISHQNTSIIQGQIMIQWLSPFGSFATIPYIINSNGEGYGFFNTDASDSTGLNSSMGSINEILLRVKFQGQAPYGTYSAIWNTKEVDALGNIIETVTQNDTSILTLIDCNSFQSYVSQSNIICWQDSNGIASIDSITNGSGNYTYNWVNDINQTITLSTNNSISNLAQGNYSCTIIDNDWGCSSTNSISISEPTFLNSSISGTNLLCFQDSSGTINLTLAGGVSPYSYSWNNGATTPNLTGLVAGVYSLTITDNNGCVNNQSITLTEPVQLTSSYTQTNISCWGESDGNAIVNFFGGTIGSNPGDTNYILGWDTLLYYLPFPLTEFTTPVGVPGGIYPYSVTDLNNCILYDTISITQPDLITLSLSSDTICCPGSNSGIAFLIATGGTSTYTYLWNTTPAQTTSFATGLSAGNYTCSVTDANGCTIQESINVYEHAAINTFFTIANPLCFGDSNGCIYTNSTGGDGNYTYLWSNGETTADICNLSPGIYSCIVSDGCLCSETILASILAPNEISINMDSLTDITNYGGNDGSIYISSYGGSGTLNISWTSDNGFLSNDSNITNLSAGFYYLDITDGNSCNYLDTIELTQPSSLWMNLDLATNTSCFDSCNGVLNITANGGDSTYTYNWTGPNSFTSTNNDLTNLCAGTYIATVNDGIITITDTFNIFQPQPITSTLLVDSIICHNGFAQAEINVWGGTQPFTYNWSNGSNVYTTTVQTGTHSINVNDQNGCSINQSFSLTNPDSIISTTSSSTINCFGGNNGSISINILSGGTSPYEFSDDNGINYQMSNTFSNLLAGNYSFLISDTNGCLGSVSTELMQPSIITSNTTAIQASCYGYCDGSVSAYALGGTSPYSYNWSNGTINLCAGFYNVIVTDINGCIVSNSAIVNEPDIILINLLIDGNNIIATSGFTSYQWYDNNNDPINGATDSIFTPSAIGNYYVTVTDTNNCSADSYSIEYTISKIEDYSSNIAIFPNPTNGKMTVKSEYGIRSIELYNTIGNQLYLVNNNKNKITETIIDLSTFAKGGYFIKININNQIINQRIILQ